ncbi:MAG: malonyl-ACP O-methyltransferase BioC [Candidatus Omnitrophota bacterium]
MKSTNFKYINRNKESTMVFVPGWATDYRIFDSLKQDCNCLIPESFHPFDFKERLLNALKKNSIERLSLFGFSLGGFVAAEFAFEFPKLVDELVLVGIRKRYDPLAIETIKQKLLKNKNAFLYTFYSQCFYNKDAFSFFKKNLLKIYCDCMELDYLLETLEYLKNSRITSQMLKAIKSVKIMHGEFDAIAPIEEARDIARSLNNAEFACLQNEGHIPYSWRRLPNCSGKCPKIVRESVPVLFGKQFPEQIRKRFPSKLENVSMNKEAIRRNFSKYAGYYDQYCNIQNACAQELIGKLNGAHFNNILDIGCGTGNYTKFLREKFPKAAIKAIDISENMIEIAKLKLSGDNIEFIVADAETIDLDAGFDLLSSNASLQWFENLESALIKYKELLAAGGVALFSVFGPNTFHELDESLKQVFGKSKSISSYNFLEKRKIEAVLSGLFNEIQIEQKIYTEKHASLTDLLKKIKYTGTRGNGARTLWSIGTLSRLEDVYKKKFNDITATYEVFFCKAVK